MSTDPRRGFAEKKRRPPENRFVQAKKRRNTEGTSGTSVISAANSADHLEDSMCKCNELSQFGTSTDNVKLEVEDPDHDQCLVLSTVSDGLQHSVQSAQSVTCSQSAAEWTGSSSDKQTEKLKTRDLNSSTTTEDIINVNENVLENNDRVPEKNDAQDYKQQSRPGNPALEGSQTKDTLFPAIGHSVTFATSLLTQGRVTGSGTGNQSSLPSSDRTLPAQLGQLMRPKSPTRGCVIPERDKSHFSLALMESKVGCEKGEKMFRVQEHEMVCAISSQTKFLNQEEDLVSSVDISCYWCNFCTYSTMDKSFLVQHIMEHRFHCKHCSYQSFSRADVIHHSVHTHPGFQETAAITQYCILLSDYLRIHSPSEIQLDHREKRKDPPQDNGGRRSQPAIKVTRNDVNKDMVQKSYSADFDLFDIHVEELKDSEDGEGLGASQEACSKSSSASSSSSSTALSCQPDPGSHMSSLVSGLVSQPMSAVTQSSASKGGQPVITQVYSASTLPLTLAPDSPTSRNTQPASRTAPQCSPYTSPSPLCTNSIGVGAMQQMCCNFHRSCGHCTCTSTSQSRIKDTPAIQYSEEPPSYMAHIKFEGGIHTPPAVSSGSAEHKLKSEVAMETDSDTAALSHAEPCVKVGLEEMEEEDPPVLMKQETVEAEDPSVPLRVPLPIHSQSQDVTVFKCYHCSCISPSLRHLRCHILSCHRGKCLVAVGMGVCRTSSQVFMCPRIDCKFSCSSGPIFLSHSQECTPWLTSETAHIASHLRECLEATISVVRETQAALTSPDVFGSTVAVPPSQVEEESRSSEVVYPVLGPTPVQSGQFQNMNGLIPSNSGLFRGHIFLITHADKTPEVQAEEKCQLQCSSKETSTDESTRDGGDTTVIPFDKDHLVAQIKAGGGSVMSKFLQSSLAGSGKKMFLISDTFQRTVKYLQCLAANVPAVSHTWITHSCTQNRLLDYKDYVLPAGISLEKHAILERSPSVTCLAGQRVLLTSSVAGFLEVWTSILELAQCKVLSKFPDKTAGSMFTDLILRLMAQMSNTTTGRAWRWW
ncbi:uncharacterized protein LOC143297013 isoform X2 [Babylonia areolata]|uniref:uncharacterized protein LOC143297013 isoform X2 n=1 Tax=Babylonia areolata TaxID=304850 RepID=UPI003FD20831